jgi:hypothetical protein
MLLFLSWESLRCPVLRHKIPQRVKQHVLLRPAQIDHEFLKSHDSRVYGIEIPGDMQLSEAAGLCRRRLLKGLLRRLAVCND